ncbi:MAG: proton-conducting transporter membrane subunit [Elusimicrobiaceae bacterium]|nr:proton-conducting transporter membrane subunit [Elusimicrobiaceae bacterium]
MIEAVLSLPAVFLVAALLIYLAGRRLPFYGIPVGLVVSLYALALSAGLFKAAVQDNIALPAEANLDWFGIPFLGSPLALRLDGMGMLSLFAVCAAGMMAHLVSAGQVVKDRNIQRYFALLSLFMAGITGIILTTNLLLIALFWELTAIAATGLIAHRYQRPENIVAAVRHFLQARTGGLLLLGSVIVAMVSFGTVGIEQILKLQRMNFVNETGVTVTAVLLLGAVMCRIGVWPFTSAPAGMANAPAPAAALVTAASGFAAVYLAVRFGAFAAAARGVGPAVLWLGLLGGMAAALCALREKDIVKAVIYCVSAEFCLAAAALGAGGGQQALFQAFCTVFCGVLLIMSGGLAAFVCKKGDMSEMGGLRYSMPTIHLVFLTGAVSLAGLPPFSGFFSKTFMGMVFQQVPGAFATALLVYLLSGIGIFRVLLLTFYGDKGKLARRAPEYEGPGSTSGTLIFAAVSCAFMGWMFTRKNVFSAMLSMSENPMPFSYPSAALTLLCAAAALAAALLARSSVRERKWKRLAELNWPEGDCSAALGALGGGIVNFAGQADRLERSVDGGLSSVLARLPRTMRLFASAVFRMPDSVTDVRTPGDSLAANAVLAAAGLVTLFLIIAVLS